MIEKKKKVTWRIDKVDISVRRLSYFVLFMMLTVRPSREDDISSITSIYSYYVLNSTCTFEVVPPTIEDMTSRRDDVLKKQLPYLVGEVNQSIVGYAYCNWFKPRAAYRFSVEISIYLDRNECEKGYGRQLLNALIQAAELVGVRKMIAGIADSANEKSIRLHRAAGFSHVGTLKSCGWKFNRWIDITLMERWIGEGDTTSPE